jgi:hypothetical protein
MCHTPSCHNLDSDSAAKGAACFRCRRYNYKASSSLLKLPTDVLQSILATVGKEARFVCTTARSAYGTPGSGIHIPQHRFQTSNAVLSTTAHLESRLRQWPGPEGVRTICTESQLADTTCDTVTAMFPQLQELRLSPRIDAQDFSSLPSGITRISMPNAAVGQQHSRLRRCTGLQALSLSRCRSATCFRAHAPMACLHLCNVAAG